MKKKLLSCIMALAMVMTLLPVTAFAADTGVTCNSGDSCTEHEAAYNGKHYATVEEAIEAANENQGGTITLLQDATMEENQFLKNQITLILDLNEHTLTSTSDGGITIGLNKHETLGSHLTIRNGTYKNTHQYGTALWGFIHGSITIESTATIESACDGIITGFNDISSGGTVINVYGTIKCGGTAIWGQGPKNEINVVGAIVTGGSYGIRHNYKFGGSEIKVENSTVQATGNGSIGIYLGNKEANANDQAQGRHRLTVTDSTIEGTWGIGVQHTDVNISGDKTQVTAKNNALDISRNDGEEHTLGNINITGGTFTGGISIEEDKNHETSSAKLSISGGTFTEELKEEYCAPGFRLVNNGDSTYGVEPDTTFFDSGSGTKTAPFVIANLDQFKKFRDSVNNGVTYKDQYIELGADIELLDTNWVPIGDGVRDGSGYTGNAFKGTFDGKGKTISGLKITSGSGDTAIGLFGVVAGGTVKDLKLDGVSINVSDNKLAGGVAGLLCDDGTVSGCTVSGNISIKDGAGGIVGRMVVSGTISGCTNNADVTCTEGGAGGIVGKAYYTQQDKTMTIENCVNTGAITNAAYHAGGISALSAANVTGCTNSGVITAGNTSAGIVAEQVNWGTVSGCTNTASIQGDVNAGGIVGWVRYQMDNAAYPKSDVIAVKDNLNQGAIGTKTEGQTGGLGWGGIVGGVYNAALVSGNENQAPSITGGTFAAGLVGNLQENADNLYADNLNIQVTNNVSATPLAFITADGSCKDLYAYNNKATVFVVQDNSQAWEAKIGERKYALLTAAVADAPDGAEIQILRDVTLNAPISAKKALTFTGVAGANGAKPVLSPAGANGLFSQAGEAEYTIRNLALQVATDGQWYIYHSANTLTIDQCDFTMPQPVAYTGNLVMGEGSPASDPDYALIFTNNTVTANARAALVGVGNGSRITDNTIDLIDEHWAGAQGDRTSMIALTAAAGGAGVTITGNTFQNANRAIAVDNSTLEAEKLTVQNNKFINVRYAFELSPIGNADCGTYDLNKNYYQFGETVSAPAIEDADSDGDHFAQGDGSTQYRPAAGENLVQNDEYYLKPTMDPSDLNTYNPPSSGGGVTTYSVTLPTDVANGKLSVSPKNAAKNTTVTLTVTPDEGYELASLTVTDKNGKTVELTKKSDTQYTFKMPASNVSIKAAFAPVETPPATLPFTDVTGHWALDAITYVYEKGMMNGTSPTTFSPESQLTRGMIVTILYRLEDEPAVSDSTFSDVDGDMYYADPIAWAADNGIVTGFPDGTFGPETSITREQLATILYRYADYLDCDMTPAADLSGYTDAGTISSYAQQAMAWANAEGLITGVTETTLRPTGTATRAQVATILMRFCENVIK